MKKLPLVLMLLFGILLLLLSQSETAMKAAAAAFSSIGLSGKTALTLVGGIISGTAAFLLIPPFSVFIANLSEWAEKRRRLKFEKERAEKIASRKAEKEKRREEMRRRTAAIMAGMEKDDS